MNKLQALISTSLLASQTRRLRLPGSQHFNYKPRVVAAYQSNALVQDYPGQNSKESCGFSEFNQDLDALYREGRVKEGIHIIYQQGISGYSPLLRRCANASDLKEGKWIHAQLIKNGIGMDVYLANQLLNMYAKCHRFEDARQVFDKMPKRDIISWTALISGYAQYGNAEEALELFRRLQWTKIGPNQFTFGTVLSVCAVADAGLDKGKVIHAYAIITGFDSDVIVGNALVAMYAKCAEIQDACQVFDKMPERDVVSWNSLIAGYTLLGNADNAVKLVRQMQCAGERLDQFTCVTLLGVCQSIDDVRHGKQVHAHFIIGFKSNVIVGNALITMYAKCGCVEDGRLVFDKMPDKTVVSWTAMISGYAQQCLYGEAIELFCRMLEATVKPNQFTFSSVLGACGSLAALEHGKQVHAQIIRIVGESSTFVGNSLITMYAECGSIDCSRKMFEKMPERDMVSWNAMIGGYAQHGYGKEALELFEQMQWGGMKPDPVTFVGVLSVCGHEGLVNEGRFYFKMMSQDYGFFPGPGHYACMVDLLGRAGHFDEAESLIKNMPFEPDAGVWGALMGACSIYGNLELGRHAAERLCVLEPENTASYVLLSHIYATAGMWDEAARVRRSLRNKGLQKKPGCSWIEIKNKIHAFVLGDQ